MVMQVQVRGGIGESTRQEKCDASEEVAMGVAMKCELRNPNPMPKAPHDEGVMSSTRTLESLKSTTSWIPSLPIFQVASFFPQY